MVHKIKNEILTYKSLSILVTQDGFSFYLKHETVGHSQFLEKIETEDFHDPETLHSFAKKLDHIFKTYSFQSTTLAFSNPYFTFVPDTFFDKSAIVDYLKFNVELFKEDHIVSDYQREIEAHLVYIPYMNYHNTLLDYTDEFEFQHFTQSLVSFTSKLDQKEKETINAFIHNKHLEIVAFKESKFLLCNQFQFETDIDLIYYILFCIEELNFNQETLILNIYHYKSPTYLLILKQYLVNVNTFEMNLVEIIN